MKFKSREDAIVKLLSKNANLLPEAASSFCGIAEAEIGTRAAQLKVLREVAAESDRRYLDLVRKVSASAIPPQDREGLHGLADSIDGVVGTLEGSGELLVEFELAELPAASRGTAAGSTACASWPVTLCTWCGSPARSKAVDRNRLTQEGDGPKLPSSTVQS
jgi:hypothetical protein